MSLRLFVFNSLPYNPTRLSIAHVFSDDKYLYDLLVTIDLKDAVPTDATKDFTDDDIKTCQVKFKKYDVDTFELLGEMTKTVDVKDVDPRTIIKKSRNISKSGYFEIRLN